MRYSALLFLLFLVLLVSATSAQQNEQASPGDDPSNQGLATAEDSRADDDSSAEDKDPESGGKIFGSIALYVEARDLMVFNTRYINKVVSLYAYYKTRPNESTLLFEDYKNNQILIHLEKSHIYKLPNLYKERLYEVRAKVGKVHEGKLHLFYEELKPTFIEKDKMDQLMK